MGKLSTIASSRLFGWVVPIVVAGLGFAAVQPLLTFQAKAAGTYRAGADVVAGYQQVYIQDTVTLVKTYITSGRQNSYDPEIANNQYVAYSVASNDGSIQVKLYNITSSSTTAIVNDGTNLDPKVDQGIVVWKKWVTDRWQIFLYNGTSAIQISAGNSSARPDIEGDLVTYATKNGSNIWESYKYTISSGATVLVNSGNNFAWPRLSGINVIYGYRLD